MKTIVLASPLLLAGTAAGVHGVHTTDTGSALAPHEAVLSTIHALRDNDTRALVYSLMTDEQIQQAKREWDTQRKQAIDPAEDREFKEMMGQLTAPGAEKALMAQIEPALDEIRPQLTMMIAMFTGMGQAALQENHALSPDEKAQAERILDAVSRTLLTNDLTDPASARKAVGILCSAARNLRVDSLTDVQRLSFDQVLDKGDIVLEALKDILVVYGISPDKWLSTFKAETVRQNGDTAVVRLHYEFLGVKDSSEYEMVKVGKRWVQKEAAGAMQGF